jgi:hypothetical protein
LNKFFYFITTYIRSFGSIYKKNVNKKTMLVDLEESFVNDFLSTSFFDFISLSNYSYYNFGSNISFKYFNKSGVTNIRFWVLNKFIYNMTSNLT